MNLSMRPWVIIVSSLILGSIGHLATDIYLPSMPYIAEFFGSSPHLVKLTFTVYLLSFCVTPLLSGPWSDSVGRRRPILVGIYISIASTLLCAGASHIYLLILGRFFQGIGLGMVMSVSRAILPDHFSGKELAKNFSYLVMLMPVALAIGPPLGGIIQDLSSWRMVFICLIPYLVGLFFLVKFVLKESAPLNETTKTNDTHSKHVQSVLMDKHSMKAIDNSKILFYLKAYIELLKNGRYIRYVLCSVLTFMGITAYLTASPFLFKEILSLSATEYGLVSLAMCGMTFISGWLNTRLIRFVSPKVLLYIVGSLMLLAGLILVWANKLEFLNIYVLILAGTIYFISVPGSFANAGTLALSTVQGNFGAATALLNTMQYIGGALSSFLISFGDDKTVFPLGCTFLTLGIFYFITLMLPSKSVVQKDPEGIEA